VRAALVFALVLLTPGCAVSLRQHAQIAVTLNEALVSVGEQLNREMAEDASAVGGVGAAEGAKDALDQHWDPVIRDYEFVVAALEAYVAAIRKADAAGDTSLLQAPVRALLDAWLRVEDIGDKVGLDVPPAPAKLVKFVTEAP
jgi:hypothetical protein